VNDNDVLGGNKPVSQSRSSAPVIHGIVMTDKNTRYLWWSIKTITILLCFFQIVTALLGLLSVSGVQQLGKVLTAIYMLFFASVLGIFEAYQLKPSAFIKIDHMYRRNFGFIFNPLGKSLYIIFIAFLSFGLEEPASLCFINGLSLCLFGGAQLALYLQYPELFEQLNAVVVPDEQ
jgi:hypothetical protein